jgi:hypothetical protein
MSIVVRVSKSSYKRSEPYERELFTVSDVVAMQAELQLLHDVDLERAVVSIGKDDELDHQLWSTIQTKSKYTEAQNLEILMIILSSDELDHILLLYAMEQGYCYNFFSDKEPRLDTLINAMQDSCKDMYKTNDISECIEERLYDFGYLNDSNEFLLRYVDIDRLVKDGVCGSFRAMIVNGITYHIEDCR